MGFGVKSLGFGLRSAREMRESDAMSEDITDKSARELFGDGRSAESTREKLLDRATDLFYTYGIHAVGLDRILKDVGVTKTTFYNHFESKDDMTCEVLRRRHEWEFQWFIKAVEQVSGGDRAIDPAGDF